MQEIKVIYSFGYFDPKMKQLPTSNRPGFFEFRLIHLKMLLGGFLLIGILYGSLLAREIYEVASDPYSLPFGNTKENPWIYSSEGVYQSICISCLIFDITGTILIIAGQIKEKRKLSLVGVGLITVGIAVSLATGLVK
jgi:hypothetical protein